MSIFNPLDPWGSFRDELNDAYRGLVHETEALILYPPRIDHSHWAQVLYGNALGFAPTLATAIAVFLSVVAIVRQRAIVNVLHAVVVVIVIGMVGPLWFTFCDWGVTFNQQMSNGIITMMHQAGVSQPTMDIPPELGTFLQIIGFIVAIPLQAVLIVMALGYPIAVMAVKFFGILVYASSALGKRTAKLFDLVVAIGLTAIFFGQPVAILMLELGIVAENNLKGGNSSIGVMVYTWLSLIAAIIAQFIVLGVCYVTVSSVAGKVRSSVTGSVESTLRQPGPLQVAGSGSFGDMRSIFDEPRRGAIESAADTAAKGAVVIGALAALAGRPEVAAGASTVRQHAMNMSQHFSKSRK